VGERRATQGSLAFLPTDVALVGLLLLLLAAGFLSLRIAPQSSEWVVTRLGACNRTLRACMNLTRLSSRARLAASLSPSRRRAT
jgi:regulator of protease activity HflC (stomatin/prohibitin superfamily)